LRERVALTNRTDISTISCNFSSQTVSHSRGWLRKILPIAGLRLQCGLVRLLSRGAYGPIQCRQ
jgi:hypothetical protein